MRWIKFLDPEPFPFGTPKLMLVEDDPEIVMDCLLDNYNKCKTDEERELSMVAIKLHAKTPIFIVPKNPEIKEFLGRIS